MKLFFTIINVFFIAPILCASSVINLYDFNGSTQNWQLTQGVPFADLHLCGDRLASWVGCTPDANGDIIAYQDALPEYTEMAFQVNESFSFPTALEFWADVSYYEYKFRTINFYSRFYLIAQNTLHQNLIYYGNWIKLKQFMSRNNPVYLDVNLSTLGNANLSRITGMGLAFYSDQDFRGKVVVDNVWVRTDAVPAPEPSTIVLLFAALVGLILIWKFIPKNKSHVIG